MKFLIICLFSINSFAGFSFSKDFLKNTIKNVTQNANQPSESEMGLGLKEALIKGIETGATKAAKQDGYLGNQLIKIALPVEAQKAESKMRKMGLGGLADQAVTSMNRAAEDAALSSIPIFKSAIQQLTFTDVVNILRGSQNAATEYLKTKTTEALTQQFKPSISTSLNKVNATKHWGTFANTYNQIPFTQKVETDLAQHVTNKAVAGLFVLVAEEELKIRKDPIARTSDLLKRVFGFAEKK